MFNDTGTCLECWGDGVMSKCCNEQVIETQSGRKKCTDCGQFCETMDCQECYGTGLEVIEDKN